MDELREIREQLLRLAVQIETYIELSFDHRRRMEDSLRRIETTHLTPRLVRSKEPRAAVYWIKYVIAPVVAAIATAVAAHFAIK